MGQPDGLVEWFSAQLDADEAAALAVRPLGHVVDMGGKRIDDRFTHSRVRQRAEDGARYVESDRAAQGHFARNDPASVLARVAAHRAILHAHGRRHDCTTLVASGEHSVADGKPWEFWEDCHYPEGEHCPTVRHLATAYADRGGWREEWRPQ